MGGHVEGIYSERGVHTTEIRAKFLMSRCPERGNAKEFLRGLRLKKEELAQVGVRISDEEYLFTIISSLPNPLTNFISMQMAWMLQQTSKAMDAGTLMMMLLQEAERQNLRGQRCKQGTGKGKEEEGEALGVSENKMRGKKNKDRKILFWGCGEEGHLRPYCPNPKKTNKDSKKTQESSKPNAKVATASVVEISFDDEGAWAAETVDVKKDWFEEVAEEELLNEKDNNFEELEFKLIENVVEELGDVLGEALVMAESVQSSAKAKLYNSGCMNHILPYKDSFENFQPGISKLQINRCSVPQEREIS